jgi:hypothetical protein
VVVALLLLLLLLVWSRKELNLGHCKCCTDDEEDIAASQKPLAIAPSRSSQSKSTPSRPNQIPSQAFNPNAISLQLGNSFHAVLKYELKLGNSFTKFKNMNS